MITMKRRPSFLNVLLYLFTKYIVVFIILAFLNNRFKNIVIDNSKDTDDIWINSFFYLVEVLWATFLLILILIIPLYLLLRIKETAYLLISFFAWTLIEYFVYEYGTSYVHFDINGIINGSISIILLAAFFGRFIFSLKEINQSNPEFN
jgi:hypothetical protein